MYKIKHDKVSNYLEVINSNLGLYGKIHLNEGASLQELTLNGHVIIKDLSPLNYSETYASSVLFPFANRIKGGKYLFQGINFQLEANQREENNALHGLVYNKTFHLVNSNITNNALSITLEFNETTKTQGFPYYYNIQLEYIFSKELLSLKVIIKNTDKKTFPFTLGWHPYFLSHNLFDSALQFDSTEKMVLNEKNITIGIEATKTKTDLKIKNKQLDDCWTLNSNKVIFKTPKYHLKLKLTGNNNFLQVYKPPKENTIAIEPTTGVSDSFNNKIGLQTLNPSQSYYKTWKLKITEN